MGEKRIRGWLKDGMDEDVLFIADTPDIGVNVPKEWTGELSFQLTAQGNLEVSLPFGETSCTGVFAAGDVSTVIKADAPTMTAGAMASGWIVRQLVMGELD